MPNTKKLWLVLNEHKRVPGAHAHLLFQEKRPTDEQSVALESETKGVYCSGVFDLSFGSEWEAASRQALLEAIQDPDFVALLQSAQTSPAI